MHKFERVSKDEWETKSTHGSERDIGEDPTPRKKELLEEGVDRAGNDAKTKRDGSAGYKRLELKPRTKPIEVVKGDPLEQHLESLRAAREGADKPGGTERNEEDRETGEGTGSQPDGECLRPGKQGNATSERGRDRRGSNEVGIEEADDGKGNQGSGNLPRGGGAGAASWQRKEVKVAATVSAPSRYKSGKFGNKEKFWNGNWDWDWSEGYGKEYSAKQYNKEYKKEYNNEAYNKDYHKEYSKDYEGTCTTYELVDISMIIKLPSRSGGTGRAVGQLLDSYSEMEKLFPMICYDRNELENHFFS